MTWALHIFCIAILTIANYIQSNDAARLYTVLRSANTRDAGSLRLAQLLPHGETSDQSSAMGSMLRAAVAASLARLLLAAQSDGNALQLHLLEAGEGGNACLDGSPFGYYIAQNSSSNDWVIDIDGGGWCDSAQSCVSRISGSSRLASSTTWAPVGSGSGITSGSPEDNPEYHTYNRVNFPYCDGSSFTSHREVPLRVQTGGTNVTLLHMRGWNNLRAAVASLQQNCGMNTVDKLIVTGGSAGGTSTFLHTDHLAELTRASHTVGLPDAGAFRVMQPPSCCAWEDIVALHSELKYMLVVTTADGIAAVYAIRTLQTVLMARLSCFLLCSDATAALPTDCTTTHSGKDAWRCFTAPTVAPFVKSPLFVLQSQFDHFQLSAMGKIPCALAQAYFPPWSNSSAAICSVADLANISAYGAGWMHDFAPMLTLPKLGAFITACVAHEERGTAGWTGLQAGGATLRHAFHAWHNALQPGVAPLPNTHWIDSCELPCNTDAKVCAPIT
jgi:hypothetical protein